MNQELRVKRLLNKVKKRYGIKDKINIKLIKKKVKCRSYLGNLWLEICFENKIPIIYIFSGNMVYKFEEISDKVIEDGLTHELIHFLAHKNWCEEDSKKLIKVLKVIDRMVYRTWH